MMSELGRCRIQITTTAVKYGQHPTGQPPVGTENPASPWAEHHGNGSKTEKGMTEKHPGED
jgi:hypothetical protein